MIRNTIVCAFTIAAISVAVACSSSDSSSGSSGGSGSASFKSCASANTPAACKQADIDSYGSCIESKCDSQYKTCYGDSYKSGSFSGPCGAWITCTQKCACNDTACDTACGAPPTACTDCTKNYSTCSQGCTLPACYSTGSSTSSTSGSASTGAHTCAQLTACCPKIPAGAVHDACVAVGGTGEDASCSAAYQAYSGQATGGSCD